ncbi:ATP-binding protein [Salimicrobium flavidum]|uniref:histidine kinase n=1 Tax=Salimicrobium flavidum TaxID=570947 RepID=A0A1N7KTQ0_9BACI|nr:ATP-binding protein [Salimicrobium flavidum]SIS64927.1 Signal transduction histidine kinase [Salimicrobium flavidum]
MFNDKPMSYMKIFISILSMLLVLTAFRVMWMDHPHGTEKAPPVEAGVLDLREISMKGDDVVHLNGEWNFYPGAFLEDTTGETNTVIGVPGDWSERMSGSSKGHGTYEVSIMLPEEATDDIYGLRFVNINTSAHVYIDGERVLEIGDPATEKRDMVRRQGAEKVLFFSDQQKIDVTVQVSNYEVPYLGGITSEVQFGKDTAIQAQRNTSLFLQSLVVIIYLLHAMYLFVLLLFDRGGVKKDVLFFAILLVLTALMTLIDFDVVFVFPFPISIYYKVILLMEVSVLLVLLHFTNAFFQQKLPWFHHLVYLYGGVVAIAVFVPFSTAIQFLPLTFLFYIGGLVYVYVQTIIKLREGERNAWFLLIFLSSFTSEFFWSIGVKAGLVDLPYYPFDLLICLVAMVFLVLARHKKIMEVNEQQSSALREVDKNKEEFLATASRELRGPLQGIINITDNVLRHSSDKLPSKNEEDLKNLLSLGNQMNFLLNDFLDISKLEHTYTMPDRKGVDLSAVVSGVISMVRFKTEAKRIHIHSDIPSPFPRVLANKNRLIQILYNLLDNAIKYTPEGSIAVYARESTSEVTVYVEDTGIGLTQEGKGRIFEPYQSESVSDYFTEGGIGLGLPIVKKLVNMHGGKVGVTSELDKGSIFFFTLPIDNQVEKVKNVTIEKDEKESANVADLNGDSEILLVDDDPVTLRVIKNILEMDYKVTTVPSAEEALEFAEERTWKLIIVDAMMPGLSGYELTREIRQKHPLSDLPVLLLVPRDLQQDIYSAYQSGANDYIVKPVDTSELQARVTGLMEMKKSFEERLRLEAAWLQAQIKPHFLFNTLNTIAHLGETDTDRMLEVLEEFSEFLQRSYSMRNEEGLVSMEDELELTRSYVNIQKARFGEKLMVNWEIGESHLKIPPLSIQTLVENAINHGILNKIDGGTVSIQVQREAGDTLVSIVDDGVGMSPEKVERIETETLGSGVGLMNTDRRLRKIFGEGLRIYSSEGQGTFVSFKVF